MLVCNKKSRSSKGDTPRGPGESAAYAKEMYKRVSTALRDVLRHSLVQLRTRAEALLRPDGAGDSDAEEVTANRATEGRGCFSGVSLRRVDLVKVTIDGFDVVVMNTGRLFVLKLDEDGFRFIQNYLPILVKKLAAARLMAWVNMLGRNNPPAPSPGAH